MVQSNEHNGTSFAVNLKLDAQQVCVYGCVSPFYSDDHVYSYFSDLDAAVMLSLQRSPAKTMQENAEETASVNVILQGNACINTLINVKLNL